MTKEGLLVLARPLELRRILYVNHVEHFAMKSAGIDSTLAICGCGPERDVGELQC